MDDHDHGTNQQHEIARLRAEVAALSGALRASAAEVDRLAAAQHRADAATHARQSTAELQHRVRNVLAVTRLVFARTAESGADLDEIKSHFLGRLGAISRIHLNILRNPAMGVMLEDLIRDELLTIGISDGPDLVLRGPEISLNPEAAEGIGLALHELATNALKFGAFRFDGARLEISWDTDVLYGGARHLTLTWTEQGVPAVSVGPGHRGFGSELILEALPYRLRADTTLEIRGGGIRCSMTFPLIEQTASTAASWRE